MQDGDLDTGVSFSLNDGWFVYIGTCLVSELGFSFDGAKDCLEQMKPWLLLNGLVPEIPTYSARVGVDREMEQVNSLNLVLDYNEKGEELIGMEVVGEKVINYQVVKDSVGRSCMLKEKVDFSYHTLNAHKFGHFAKPARPRPLSDGEVEVIEVNMYEIRYFPVQTKLDHFIFSVMGGKGHKIWKKEWRKLWEKEDAEILIREAIKENEALTPSEMIALLESKKP